MDVNKALYRYKVNRQDILKAALLIREHEAIGSIPALDNHVEFQRARKAGREWLDRSLDIIKHMPEDEVRRAVLERYAFGQLGRGRPGQEIRRFWEQVPGEAIVNMAPVAAQVLV